MDKTVHVTVDRVENAHTTSYLYDVFYCMNCYQLGWADNMGVAELP